MWCIPPQQNAAFVCAMEKVLDVYQRPYAPDYPVVCMDETSKQLVAETRTPLPPRPGEPERHDYEYERHGTANIFLFADHFPVEHVQGGEERGRAIPLVVMGHGAAAPLFHRQAWLGAIQRLNLALLIDREHQGLLRRT
jgi:hypothetical protein